MIEIISRDNRQQYHALLESMFRLRYQVFVSDWGWRIPGLTGKRDCDAFDTEDTVYFVERAHGTHDVRACARVNPTTKPHMFSELFEYLCDLQPVQTGVDVFEASRYAIDRTRMTARELIRIKGEIEWAITWYCLHNNISKMTWFMRKEVYARYIQLWKTQPLGIPVHFEDDDHTYIPAISNIELSALARISKRYRLSETMPICIHEQNAGRLEVFSDAHAVTKVMRKAA
jgi:acyl-homoserine lactone synthase